MSQPRASIPATKPEAFGSRLRRVRLERGLSQRAVARRLGRPSSLVCRWESGLREPTIVDLALLCGALGILEGQLLDGVARPAIRRRSSSRAHSARLRRAVGGRLRAERVALGIDHRSVYERIAMRGTRLEQIEGGTDASVGELLDLRCLLNLRVAKLVARARLDAQRDLDMVGVTR